MLVLISFLNVFTNHHYEVYQTGTDSSHRNGPVKRAHRVIGDHVRAIFISANLDTKFWPYAFSHHLHIKKYNCNEWSEYLSNLSSNWKERIFSRFRTYGCQTWICPPFKRSAKFKHNTVKGIFLGFIPRTVQNILWYNCETSKNGPANHVKFDEVMNDLPFKLLSLIQT